MATNSGSANFVYAIVALAVVVIIISTVAVPVIEDAQSEIKSTGQNSTQLYAMSSGAAANVSITYSDGAVIVNDYSISDGLNDRGYIFAMCDSFFVDYANASPYLRVWSEDGLVSTGSVSISGGTLTCVNSSDSSDVSIDVVGNLLYASDTGDYGDFYSHQAININETSTIYTVYRNAIFSTDSEDTITSCLIMSKGTLKDGLTTQFYNLSGGSPGTVSAVSIELDESDISDGPGYKILNPTGYLADGYDITAKVSAANHDYERMLNQPVIAPIKYTYISSTDSSAISLLDIIPIMLILVAVMMAVGLMRGRS